MMTRKRKQQKRAQQWRNGFVTRLNTARQKAGLDTPSELYRAMLDVRIEGKPQFRGTECTIRNWCKGASVPDAAYVPYLAKALKMPVAELLDWY